MPDAMPDDEVVLQCAYSFVCPSCSRKNYGDNVEAELTDDERRALLKMMGDDDDSEAWKGDGEPADPTERLFQVCGGLVTNPNRVTCAGCGKAFKVFADPDTALPDGFDPHRDLT